MSSDERVPDPDTAGPEGRAVHPSELLPTEWPYRGTLPSPPEASPDTGREALAAALTDMRGIVNYLRMSEMPTTAARLDHDINTLAALSRSPERATADNDSKGEQR
jgi:hypothetical protein